MKSSMLMFFIISSLCFAQSELAVIELYDGKVYIYNSSGIKDISVAGEIVSISEEQTFGTVINSFVLHQNFPNPFNPVTTIKYEIPDRGLVEINIYDVQGELIHSPGSTIEERGVHTISWDGKNDYGNPVSSGVYFCQIVYNNTFLTKKMLLIR